MTQEKMEELARAAAHSALIASCDKNSLGSHDTYVDEYLKLYEYAMKKLYEKQQQAQSRQVQSEQNSRYNAIKQDRLELKHGRRL